VWALRLGAVGLLLFGVNGQARGAEYNWTGAYLGTNLGVAWGTSDFNGSAVSGALPFAGSIDFLQLYNGWNGTGSYFIGLQGGYNWMLPSGVVIGAETDVLFPNRVFGARSVAIPEGRPPRYEEEMLMAGSARARLGYAIGNWLPYATGGFAWTFNRTAWDQIEDGFDTIEHHLLWRFGWTVGGGIEFPFAPNWTARAEYLYTQFDRHDSGFPGAGAHVNSGLSLSQARLGVSYRLPSDHAAWNAVTAHTLAPDMQNFAVHAQSTFTQQYAAPFRDPYQGRNSLAQNSGREGWSITVYAGFKPWEGAEIWVSPETNQGFALSNFRGVAGFPYNDPALGSSYPFARIQRAFLRQNINLGGDVQKVEADLYQFPMTQTENRLEVTVGKFSVLDIFSLNKYAQDARVDFMNLAFNSTGTFDYASDTFGYTYGAAAEWYQGSWTLRAGYFDMSRNQAAEELDPKFRQFQWVGEIERRYELFGHPGKVLITGFHTRAHLGAYNEAVSLAELTGEPANVLLVRRPRGRSGIGMSLEQQLNPDLGFFARAGLANGNIQDYEITDIDRTVAIGISQSGKPWGRPDDIFGLATAVNNISSAHKAYFNAGGMGVVIGDGMLPHPSLEEIIETYYRYAVTSLWDVTLDYQFINNPAYNRDRGPVSVVAVRLHAEF
jgi:high affinity Mn2+ porin